MSFHSSVDTLHHLDASTEHLTRLLDTPDVNEEMMNVEEIRQLLKLPESNSLGAYDDIHTIGVGGFGTVYAAREPGLERKLALKLLRPRYRERRDRVCAFIREARITAHIAHPNVVPVHRIGVFDDAGVYFSMKRVAGETLRAILSKLRENRPGYRKKYSLPRLLDIFIGACQGVSYAHQNGILHCDLKPENLMVGNFGEVLVMDWGMARCLPESCLEQNMTLPDNEPPKQIGGTPVFMAPEHLSLSSNEPTVRSDIYALGCVLYSILTWKTSPFEEAKTLEEIQKKVVQEKLPPPRRCAPASQPLPRELESICLKAMARNPEKRYESVEALIEDLRHYRDGLPVDAYASSPVYKFSKLLFRRPLIPATLFLSLLLWWGFSLYTAFNDYVYARTLKINALNMQRQGTQKIQQVQRRINQLNNGSMDLTQMLRLENAVVSDSADAESAFKTTLDILERIPQEHRNPRNIDLIATQIFRSLAELYTQNGNDQKLHDSARLFMERWKKIFIRARKNDPRLDSMFTHALSGLGTLQFYSDDSTTPEWYLEDSSGKRLKDLKMTPSPYQKKPYAVKLRLPPGIYSAVLRTQEGTVYKIPLRSSLTSVTYADLTPPGTIPEEMVFVPGGEFLHTPEISNNFRRHSFEEGFLIKKTEVTVAEYLEFWKTLKDPQKKILYASYYFDSKESMQGKPSWDEKGRLLRPGLALQHPVTGISGHAADAYCRYLSKKMNRPITLPTRSQWSKAAGGIEGTDYSWGNTYHEGKAVINAPGMKFAGASPGDRSVYGVLDLSGNVREFVKVPVKDLAVKGEYAISGGSFFTYPEISKNSNIVFSFRGGNDVGFRYVMPVEKEKKTAVVKND